MKITFIGSSHGVPEAHRKCTCIMVEVGENIYFVDMGTMAIDALRTRGLSPDAVKGIFITHMHGDHTNGLIQFVDLLTWYFKTPDPVICLPDLKAGEVIDSWLQVSLNGCEKPMQYRQTQPGVVYDDGTAKVTAIATMHCPGSHAYLFEAEGKAVLFTGDLAHPGKDFPQVAFDRELDLAVCESAHFAASEYVPMMEKCSLKKVCVTHYVNQHIASILALKEALAERGVPVVMANDDMVLNV